LSSQTDFENVYLFATFTNGVHKGCFWTGLGEPIKAFGAAGKGKSTLGNLGEALRFMLQETCLSRILIRPTTQNEPMQEELLG
jgi:hypothetical protein